MDRHVSLVLTRDDGVEKNASGNNFSKIASNKNGNYTITTSVILSVSEGSQSGKL